MSWNVVLVKLSTQKETLSHPEAYLLPLDAELGVVDRLASLFPHMKFESLPRWGTWGYLNGHEYTVQIKIGKEAYTHCKTITLHMRGWNCDGLIAEFLAPLCAATSWLAFDLSEGTRVSFAAEQTGDNRTLWRLARETSFLPRRARALAVGMF